MIYKIHNVTLLNQLPLKIDIIDNDIVIGFKRRFQFQIHSYIEGVIFTDGVPSHSQYDMTYVDMDTTEENAVNAAVQIAAVTFMAVHYPNTP